MGQHEENQRLRDKYQAAFGDVRAIIDRLDPIGLLAGGPPDDEYDPQVTDLVRLVLRSDLLGEAQVDGVWRRWFGDDFRGRQQRAGKAGQRAADTSAALCARLGGGHNCRTGTHDHGAALSDPSVGWTRHGLVGAGEPAGAV